MKKSSYLIILFCFIITEPIMSSGIHTNDWQLPLISNKENCKSISLLVLWTATIASQFYLNNNDENESLFKGFSIFLWGCAGAVAMYILAEKEPSFYSVPNQDL